MSQRIPMIVDGRLESLWKYPRSRFQIEEEEFFMRWVRLGGTERPEDKHDQQGHSAGDLQAPTTDLPQQGESRVKQNEPTASQEQHRAAERYYWDRQLRLTKWMNWTAGIAAVASIGTLLLIWGTLEATQTAANAAKEQAGTARGQLEEMKNSSADTKAVAEAAKIQATAAITVATTAQQQLELSQRPWIAENFKLNGPFEFDSNGGASLSVQFRLVNVGHSAATGIEIHTRMFPFSLTEGSFYEPMERQREVCEEGRRNRSRESHELGIGLLPGERIEGSRTVKIKEEEIADALDAMDFRLPRTFIFPILVGCIDYQFTFAPERHATGFIYGIYRRHPDKPEDDLGIEINETLPRDRVKLERFPFGARYID